MEESGDESAGGRSHESALSRASEARTLPSCCPSEASGFSGDVDADHAGDDVDLLPSLTDETDDELLDGTWDTHGDGEVSLDTGEDEIIRETLVARDGRIVHPRVLEALGERVTAGSTRPLQPSGATLS